VFDPTEVVPEYTADVGTKKGEKVDYAIMRDGRPIILIEVKCWNVDLAQVHASQLYRYFSVTEARFAILTNGTRYMFFTDLEQSNKMDEKPFFELDMLTLRAPQLAPIRQFSRDKFDMETLLTSAGELKYTKGILRAIEQEFEQPSDELVRYFTKQVYSGNLTKAVRDQFCEILKRAFKQFINDAINERLNSALRSQESTDKPESETTASEGAEAGLETSSPLKTSWTGARSSGPSWPKSWIQSAW